MSLALSRKRGERILIGSDISIKVVRLTSQTVRLAIEAPRHMTIMREEVVDRSEFDEICRSRASESIASKTTETADVA